MKREPVTAFSCLGIGAMSNEVISAVYAYSHETQVPLMLLCSKNQVDYASGYVHTTASFVEYCRSCQENFPLARVFLCRDHCGPGFNGERSMDDVYRTVRCDIEHGFQLLHLDFCHLQQPTSLVRKEYEKAIEVIRSASSEILLEIGTEENTGVNFKDLVKVEDDLRFFCSFCAPTFFVCQTGTVVKEINQAGHFDVSYAEALKKLADRYHVAIKEHNADYLPAEEIGKRRSRIQAMNIAPQMGVVQTTVTLQKALMYGFAVDDFLNEAYESRKWEKWLWGNTSQNKMLCSVIAGHYVFRSQAYRRLFDLINRQEHFVQTIQQEIKQVIDVYISQLVTGDLS